MLVLLGLFVGFFAAIPLGPINVFIISQTLKRDYLHGLFAGITAGLLDFIYCLIPLLGFFHIEINLSFVVPYIKVLGVLLLFVISYRLVRQSRTISPTQNSARLSSSSPRPIIGVFLLYISNPALYAFWLAVAGIVTSHNIVPNYGFPPVFFAICCGLGSIIWYVLLVHYVAKHHHLFPAQTFKKILRILAVILAAFALYLLSSLFFKNFSIF